MPPMNPKTPEDDELSLEGDPHDEEELSLFDDPASIHYVDPNMEAHELSLADTQEMIFPEPVDRKVITLNKENKQSLCKAMRRNVNVLSRFPKAPDDEILSAHYILVILDALLKKDTGVIFKSTVKNKLKNENYPLTNSRYDEDIFNAAFLAVHTINENGI